VVAEVEAEAAVRAPVPAPVARAPVPVVDGDIRVESDFNVSRRWLFNIPGICMDDIFKKAQHNPPHLFRPHAVYMLTASTYQRDNIIHGSERKIQWRDAFIKAAELSNWRIIAWVVLSNHYHAIIESPDNAQSLAKMTGSCHKFTSRLWNDADNTPGRKVWWNYWDTCIRSETDYLNRFRYVLWNPVKHKLVEKPEDYLFSNYQDVHEWQGGFDFTDLSEVNDVPEF
jgi:putative transposase